ncbi:MAG: methyltransferase domain-containing protein [Caldilineaceae bacterium]
MSRNERRERWIAKARHLLTPALSGNEGGVWADLGCGDGIFTFLLCELLAPGSRVYALDRDRLALGRVAQRAGALGEPAPLTTVHGDFTRPLRLPPLDDILLANALHFVADKQPVLASLVRTLKLDGRLLVVEYNTRRGNYAVPHPLDEEEFLSLAQNAELVQVEVVVRVPSTFLGEMYTGRGFAPGDAPDIH